MIFLLIALQILDGATTYYAIAKKGLAERNPLINWLIGRLGLVPSILLAKTSVIALLVTLPFPAWLIYALAGLYFYVVGNNLYRIAE